MRAQACTFDVCDAVSSPVFEAARRPVTAPTQCGLGQQAAWQLASPFNLQITWGFAAFIQAQAAPMLDPRLTFAGSVRAGTSSISKSTTHHFKKDSTGKH
jgi:hypothetical protein